MRPVKASSPAKNRRLLLEDVADLARGCAFLGSGGGGDPHTAFMEIEAALARGGVIELIELDSLADDAFVAPCGWIGAPTVSVGKASERTGGIARAAQARRDHAAARRCSIPR